MRVMHSQLHSSIINQFSVECLLKVLSVYRVCHAIASNNTLLRVNVAMLNAQAWHAHSQCQYAFSEKGSFGYHFAIQYQNKTKRRNKLKPDRSCILYCGVCSHFAATLSQQLFRTVFIYHNCHVRQPRICVRTL